MCLSPLGGLTASNIYLHLSLLCSCPSPSSHLYPPSISFVVALLIFLQMHILLRFYVHAISPFGCVHNSGVPNCFICIIIFSSHGLQKPIIYRVVSYNKSLRLLSSEFLTTLSCRLKQHKNRESKTRLS